MLRRKKKPRGWHTYRIVYSDDGQRVRIVGSLWLITIPMLPAAYFATEATVRTVLAFRRPFASFFAVIGLGLFYLLIACLQRFVRLTIDKRTGTYKLERGWLGIASQTRSGPISDIKHVGVAVHDVEDPDTHVVHVHDHLNLRIGDSYETLFELSGADWERLHQMRELAAFLECPLHRSAGPLPKADGACVEDPDTVRRALAEMDDVPPDEQTVVASASAIARLRTGIVTLAWVIAPYLAGPLLAMAVYWSIHAVYGDISRNWDARDLRKALVAVVVPLSMIAVRCWHGWVFACWVEDRRLYCRRLLGIAIVLFSIVFGLVAVHDYQGWEWLGSNSMDYYLGRCSVFPIQVMQNYWGWDLMFLLMLMPATFRGYLRKRIVRDEKDAYETR